MKKDFKVTFWGVRGSHPVPGKNTLKFGGNTTCLEVSIDSVTIIIDAGTGIINLGNRIVADFFSKGGKPPLELTLLFTHLHQDHTQGLPFFVPYYLGQSILNFFGPLNFNEELHKVLEKSMAPPNFPIDFDSSSSVKNINTVKENSVILLDTDDKKPQNINIFHNKPEIKNTSILIRIMNGFSHPSNGIYIYRIEYGGKSVVFCTDVEGYLYGDSKLINFAKGADLLIHDAQYSKEQYTSLPVPRQGFGHSTPEMAIEVAKAAEVKNLAITHHDPASLDKQLDEYNSKYKKQFDKLFYTREGETFQII
ncbi:MAG TPA: MBL fold metallo-hydrolase [Spirochaetes bacterium]|nr:MBL fold metallo-hydrolase [Spirochaetota bacterium]